MYETKHVPEQKNAHIHTWKYRGREKRETGRGVAGKLCVG